MNLRSASHTARGKRQRNEDITGSWIGDHSAGFAVCDGVAGTPGGEIAATLACRTLMENGARLPRLTPALTAELVARAEGAIAQAQQTRPACRQMRTTLVALFADLERQRVWWVHAGDSRLYHFRQGVLHSVTRDHSLRQQFIDAGHENTGISGQLLYNALGNGSPAQHSWHGELALQDGDAFLLCSDGFWNALETETMARALRLVNSVEEWLTLMIQAVKPDAEQDNLSALAVWFGSPQESTLLMSPGDVAPFLPPPERGLE